MSDPFPQCVAAGSNAENVYFAIRAEWSNYPFGFASSVRVTFGMALWTAMIIHIFGVEIYVSLILLIFWHTQLANHPLDSKDGGIQRLSSWICP